ncbi:nucleoside triphosphate pyrophosphohydrolase [Baaleninema simplex]|uniref:nucleoside triphosphate pyrophosphohydrolase n=1 Tax=Baaleninema simplex TaxID=2862350 RepID=UPI00034800F7|nr:nucleoside triphosphate pyrophosphohydrolase [Baaleninema simplex]
MRREPQKLVRDRIPEIVRRSGRRCGVERLDIADYRQALRDKLVEEAIEAAEARDDAELIRELADLSEAIDALLETYEIDRATVSAKQQQRRDERGGFRQRLKLLWTEDDEETELSGTEKS